MSNVVLATMTVAQIREVVQIERSVFTTPWTEEMFRQEVEGMFGSRAIVASIADCVVGYRIAWDIEDEVHLVNIAVALGHQGRGIGTLMLGRLIEDAIGTGKQVMTLEVRESNVRAQAFYRRFLFRTIGVRKGYYSDNREDALLMALDLREFAHRRAIEQGRSRIG